MSTQLVDPDSTSRGPTPSPGSSTAPGSWESRPWAARAIRAVVLLGPFSAGVVAAIGANRVLPPTHVVATTIARCIAVVAASTAAVFLTDRVARRLLPLAALMRLSLVFPDQAPSRFKSALKAGSSRRLERLVEEARQNGLAEDPGDAARQVVDLIAAIGDHDRRTRGHCERVRLYADLIGEEMRLPAEERQKLQWGALLHDLGKLMVPPEILNKTGRPDPDEWAVIEGHPVSGMLLVEPMRDFLGEWADAIGGHHEKWDGSGYPFGLSGDEIPRSAAIVAVADSFEVMTAVRSYKKAMSLSDARAELTRCAGTHFSPDVVRAFLSISLGRLRLVAGPLASLAHLRPSFGGDGQAAPTAPPTGIPATFLAEVSTGGAGASGGAGAAGAAGAGAAGAGVAGAAGIGTTVIAPAAAILVALGLALAVIVPVAASVGHWHLAKSVDTLPPTTTSLPPATPVIATGPASSPPRTTHSVSHTAGGASSSTRSAGSGPPAGSSGRSPALPPSPPVTSTPVTVPSNPAPAATPVATAPPSDGGSSGGSSGDSQGGGTGSSGTYHYFHWHDGRYGGH